jgi:hypothetical protein
MTYLLIPLFILLGIAVFFGIVVFLGRFRGGKYMRPIIATLSKIGFMRRWFQKISTAQLERQNPELATALRKMQRAGTNPDPQKAQQALSTLSANERRAYMEAVQEQGAMPEPANRQQRRLQQKLQQGNRPPSSGGGSANKKKKR